MRNDNDKIYVATIEDDESLSRALGRFLRASGYHPVSYRNAEAFLADTKHPVFECMLVDIQLGGMSGIELAEHLASTGSSKIPVIFLTADEKADELKHLLHSLCTALIRKSDVGNTLLAAINNTANA